jgi:calcineurin-like phosphoesterase family protein
MMKEYEQVVLTEDLPKHDLKAGDLGTVVMIHGDHAGYELEIFSADGRTLDVVTVEAHQVRPVSRRDVLHVRELTV